jgi:hypothetical protein
VTTLKAAKLVDTDRAGRRCAGVPAENATSDDGSGAAFGTIASHLTASDSARTRHQLDIHEICDQKETKSQ